ncbi:conserved hypothetical protein [Trichinella spiralis]|uniref:hypothetical protein n=1 Tax=Trichinella spiralis TaxID=6334 RepID=UPI0001EFDEAD|nr:conserved hypothetical protein [Trichinella spiralis]
MVTMTSTYFGVNPVRRKQRWSKKQRIAVEISVLVIVRNYNLHMGGVDLNIMLSEELMDIVQNGLQRSPKESIQTKNNNFYWKILPYNVRKEGNTNKKQGKYLEMFAQSFAFTDTVVLCYCENQFSFCKIKTFSSCCHLN